MADMMEGFTSHALEGDYGHSSGRSRKCLWKRRLLGVKDAKVKNNFLLNSGTCTRLCDQLRRATDLIPDGTRNSRQKILKVCLLKSKGIFDVSGLLGLTSGMRPRFPNL